MVLKFSENRGRIFLLKALSSRVFVREGGWSGVIRSPPSKRPRRINNDPVLPNSHHCALGEWVHFGAHTNWFLPLVELSKIEAVRVEKASAEPAGPKSKVVEPNGGEQEGAIGCATCDMILVRVSFMKWFLCEARTMRCGWSSLPVHVETAVRFEWSYCVQEVLVCFKHKKTSVVGISECRLAFQTVLMLDLKSIFCIYSLTAV